jgi:hypothetical protein
MGSLHAVSHIVPQDPREKSCCERIVIGLEPGIQIYERLSTCVQWTVQDSP